MEINVDSKEKLPVEKLGNVIEQDLPIEEQQFIKGFLAGLRANQKTNTGGGPEDESNDEQKRPQPAA